MMYRRLMALIPAALVILAVASDSFAQDRGRGRGRGPGFGGFGRGMAKATLLRSATEASGNCSQASCPSW